MYDELVKRLRYCSEERNGCGMCALSSDCVLRVGLLTQAADAIEELFGKVEQLPRWVSVADRLPEPEGHREYIVCVKHSNPELKAVFVTTAEFEARVVECGVEPFWDGYADGIIRVTHWMPFPEPPKEET